MCLAGFQINLIDVNFHLQKSLKNLKLGHIRISVLESPIWLNKLNPFDVNFHLQKSLEIFDKKSVDKIWSKKDKGWKVPSLKPIKVKLRK